MEPITINPTICSGCGSCIDECPRHLLVSQEDGGTLRQAVPRLVHGDLCIQCGHCAAVCPTAAIQPGPDARFRLAEFGAESGPAAELLQRKRSVRHFDPERGLDRALVARLLEAAERAPVSHNHRHRGYLVLEGRSRIDGVAEKLVARYRRLLWLADHLALPLAWVFWRPAWHRLRGLAEGVRNLLENHDQGYDPLFRQAACVVCVSSAAGEHFAADDTTAAATYLMLQARSLGIDSVLVGYAQHYGRTLGRWLGLPKTERIMTVVALGYARHNHHRLVFYPMVPVRYLD